MKGYSILWWKSFGCFLKRFGKFIAVFCLCVGCVHPTMVYLNLDETTYRLNKPEENELIHVDFYNSGKDTVKLMKVDGNAVCMPGLKYFFEGGVVITQSAFCLGDVEYIPPGEHTNFKYRPVLGDDENIPEFSRLDSITFSLLLDDKRKFVLEFVKD